MSSVARQLLPIHPRHPIVPKPLSETEMATVTKTTTVTKAAKPRSEAEKATVAEAKAATKATKARSEAEKTFKRAQRAAILLKQVSDPTRLQVITMLSEGERHVGGLCGELNQSQPAVSHHLALLRHGGIIAPRRQGKNNFYSLTETGEPLARIVKTLVV